MTWGLWFSESIWRKRTQNTLCQVTLQASLNAPPGSVCHGNKDVVPTGVSRWYSQRRKEKPQVRCGAQENDRYSGNTPRWETEVGGVGGFLKRFQQTHRAVRFTQLCNKQTNSSGKALRYFQKIHKPMFSCIVLNPSKYTEPGHSSVGRLNSGSSEKSKVWIPFPANTQRHGTIKLLNGQSRAPRGSLFPPAATTKQVRLWLASWT